MKVAEVLSDLTSLRACDHNEALALVNSHKTVLKGDVTQDVPASGQSTTSRNNARLNPDLQRASDLLELHREAKLRHQNYYQAGGLNEELSRIRRDVDRVAAELEAQRRNGR
ncbi:hypothetical protein VTO42DRAFT_880 [Malbranchea cinnamomea]